MAAGCDVRLLQPQWPACCVSSSAAEAQIVTLAKALSASRMLIVLDNCEHLLNAVGSCRALHRAARTCACWPRVSAAEGRAGASLSLGALACPQKRVLKAQRQGGRCGPVRSGAGQPTALRATEHNIAAVSHLPPRTDCAGDRVAAARLPLLGVDGCGATGERFSVLKGAHGCTEAPQTCALHWTGARVAHARRADCIPAARRVRSFSLESAQRVTADDRIDRWAMLTTWGVSTNRWW